MLFVLAGLVVMAVGLVGFAAAWLGLVLLQKISMALFIVCWGIAAASWFGFIIGLLSGRYRKLENKEQVW